MTLQPIWVTAVLVWLLGLFTAWCLGYAARNRPAPARHSGPAGQLAQVRLAALDELDQLGHRRHCEAHRVPAPAPVAVHVHVAAPLPWTSHHSLMPADTARFLDAMPVLPAEEVQS